MKVPEALEMLKGEWSGKGKGTYGPFTAKAHMEERGRWLLMREEIKVPVVGVTTYVSTQVYGSDDGGLTLDFFDTAGAFKFHGTRDGDCLRFEWEAGRNKKSSTYWKEDDQTLRFKYDSVEEQEDADLKHLTFEGVLERKD
jgi:hypothetical protein